MDSFHKDEINFGTQEAIRMHANQRDPWVEAEKWLKTTTGQEFCDELVYDTVHENTLNALLRSFGANINQKNRDRLVNLANAMMTQGEA